jgi:L-fuculose-phosphate aldolase
MTSPTLRPIGWVRASLDRRANAPKQGYEGAPNARLELESAFLRGLETRPLTGVFGTRSPDRPNPIGLHRVKVLAIEAGSLLVQGLEVVDGTPVVDIKPARARRNSW